MFNLVWYSAKLFFKGKLLRDPLYVYKQLIFGILLGSFILVGLEGLLTLIGSQEVGLSFTVALIISSVFTGIIMPFLLKDMKMQWLFSIGKIFNFPIESSFNSQIT